MTTPAPPPEAVLLRLARKAAGITVADAAEAAGISKAWLSSIENGFDTRTRTGIRRVQAKDDVVARLAALYRISPERLEAEGCRPDAAAVLREMLRDNYRAQVPRSVHGEPAGCPPGWEPSEEAAGRYPGDAGLQYVWDTPFLDEDVKQGLIDMVVGARERRARERRGALSHARI